MTPGPTFARVLIVLAVGLAHPPVRADPAPPRAPDAPLLARWMTALQYADPALPSFGALRVHPAPAARNAAGRPYQRVSPYFANLAVLGLLRSEAPGALQTAQRWISWYLTHLGTPDGVPYEHFYFADGTGETVCADPDVPALCRANDATDSAAATFLSVLQAARRAGLPPACLNAPERRGQIEALAAVVLSLQQPDGLCWAKSDFRVKYLEDNCEVAAGLRDLSALERDLFRDPQRAELYAQAAERVRRAILRELYDPTNRVYAVAKLADGRLKPADLSVWYPDTQAQAWPLLFGVTAPDAPETRAAMAALNARWNGQAGPDWASAPERVNNGWTETAVAHAALLAGDTSRARTHAAAIKRLKFPRDGQPEPFAWPFTAADAGWLLQTLHRLDAE